MVYKKVVKQVKRHIKKVAKDKKRVKKVAKSIKIFKFLAKKQKRLLKKEGNKDNRQKQKYKNRGCIKNPKKSK